MKRILVTGANKGIGYAIAERVLEETDDSFVFLGARDADRGGAAVKSLRQPAQDRADRVHLVELDVASDASVARAAEDVSRACAGEPLYGLVNNAGIGFGSSDLAEVFNVNTRGIQRVCQAFLPLVGDGGRVVNITSASGPNFVATCSAERQAFFTNPEVTWAEIDALLTECEGIGGDKDAFAARGLGDGSAYGLSKACANALTLHLARENPRLTINVCTPGFIATDLTQGYVTDSGRSPSDLGMKTPRDGAESALFLLFGEPEGSGHYYGSDAKRSPLDRYRAPGTPPFIGD